MKLTGKKENEKIEKLKTDFISLSSHQLRTPLSAVKWFTEILMSQRSGKLNKKQLGYVKEIHHSNERAIALVNDLLQVSRVQEGKLHLDVSSFDLAGLVEEVVDANRTEINSRDISVDYKVINGPLDKVSADKIKLRRVIENLLSNAIRYTPRGGKVELKLKDAGKNIECSVADSGVGIPQDQQESVFSKFFRATNVTKIQPDGTGLGLFIARALIEAHGGKIWFESAENLGTTFFFSIPVKAKR